MFTFKFLQPHVISNYKYNVCKDCKHFSPSKLQGLKDSDKIEYGKCKLFREKDLITGEIEYEYASVCRVSKCKVEGVYFEPKEES
jgi:hypothetical protein